MMPPFWNQGFRKAGSLLPPSAPSGDGWKWAMRLKGHRPVRSLLFTAGVGQIRSPKLARLEAALFVAEGALSAKKLAQIAALEDSRETVELIRKLNEAYDADRSAFRIEHVAAGYQLLTLSSLSPWLDRVHHRQARLKVSPPMLETLAIIAYRQPCTRADVEAIRGVQCAEIIKQLMERNFVRVVGEDSSLGRPYLYGTTRLFLETFGLTTLDDLPMADRLRRPAAGPSTTSASEEESSSGETQAA